MAGVRQSKRFQAWSLNWFGKVAGFVQTGPAPAGIEDTFGTMIVITLLGAFCGIIFGLITTHLLRYLSFLMGRHLGGYQWVIVSALLGAILFAGLAAIRDESD